MSLFLFSPRTVRFSLINNFQNPRRKITRNRVWERGIPRFGGALKVAFVRNRDFSSTQSKDGANVMDALQRALQDKNLNVMEEKLEKVENFKTLSPNILKNIVNLYSDHGLEKKAQKLKEMLNEREPLDKSAYQNILLEIAKEGTIDDFFSNFRLYLTEGYSLSTDLCANLLEQLAKRHEWTWSMELLAEYQKMNKPLPDRGLRAIVTSLREVGDGKRLMTLLHWCEHSGPLDIWYYNEALQLYASQGALRGMQLVCAHFRQLGVLPNKETTSIVVGVCQEHHQPELATKMLY